MSYYDIVLLRLNSFEQRYFITRLTAHQFDMRLKDKYVF